MATGRSKKSKKLLNVFNLATYGQRDLVKVLDETNYALTECQLSQLTCPECRAELGHGDFCPNCRVRR